MKNTTPVKDGRIFLTIPSPKKVVRATRMSGSGRHGDRRLKRQKTRSNIIRHSMGD